MCMQGAHPVSIGREKRQHGNGSLVIRLPDAASHVAVRAGADGRFYTGGWLSAPSSDDRAAGLTTSIGPWAQRANFELDANKKPAPEFRPMALHL